MTSKYSGYRPYHIRESLLTWQPGQSRAVTENIYHASNYTYKVPDAKSLSSSLYGLATDNLHKQDFIKPEKT
jgi:hypothetical protein